jgi:hypothetical protein
MNQRRILFFTIFGTYHLMIFLFTLYMDAQKQDFGLLSKMLYNISLFKYGALLGIVLFAIDFVWAWRDRKFGQKEVDASRHEINVLKAKVYDLQESEKKLRAEAQAKANSND